MGTVPALEARSLSLSWDGTPIAHDISLCLQPGEIACVLGRSGCGKTTLFHALAGLTQPDSGQVLLHGEDITGVPGRVSYMLQKDLLLPSRTIVDNCTLPLILRGVSKQQARVQVYQQLELFGLEGTGELWPHQLSGGMRQRAALLRTYLMDNDVVLLDEPFSALDAITRTELRSWFCTMAGELGLSALVITHDIDEALVIADEVYVMCGSPAKTAVPSKLVGSVRINRGDCARGSASFNLEQGYVAVKRQVDAFLNCQN